ncbi:MAG: N-acetylmuramoyl-L-alanine amidase [Bacillota bacterium]
MEGEELHVKVKVFDVERKKEILLDMEEYVEGAVAYAMPAEFPLEALKAQAVCSRTIAVRKMKAFGGSGCRRYPGFKICTDPDHCQGFLDEEGRKRLWGSRFEEYAGRIKKAVENTAGLILTYNGKPIEAVYHRACGGCTGMCQHGARTMALLGFPLDEILKFYFTGVELVELERPTSEKPLAGRKIAIDPGRGGEANHCGPMGLSEGYVNLEIARSLEALLKKEGAQVVMTRSKNEYKSLSERAQVINESNAEIAVIIHQNFWDDERQGGTESFYLPEDEKGRRLCLCIHRELISSLGLADLGVKEADLYLLRETRVPSVLINVACLSNPEEERLLSDRNFREKAANAILSGIKAYYHGHL